MNPLDLTIPELLNHMAEQVVVVDESGKILLVNAAAEKLFKVESSQVIGKSFIATVRQARINELVQKTLNDQQERFMEAAIFFPEEKYFEIRISPILNREKAKGVLLVMHDLTRLHKLEQMRKEFVANVSHELRTPLTSIQGFAETLLSGALSDPKHNKEFVESIDGQAKRLTQLVNDLLDLSAIESGKKNLQWSHIRLHELIHEVRELIKPVAEKYSIKIEIALPPENIVVRADRDQLKQVLLNLIDNGIKFNKEGGTVTVQASANESAVKIDVKDTGIGIPEKDLPRIFERFYRVDKARSRELGGTGLGLAIVKHIIEAHHGNIKVKSILGTGSTFNITLPTA